MIQAQLDQDCHLCDAGVEAVVTNPGQFRLVLEGEVEGHIEEVVFRPLGLTPAEPFTHQTDKIWTTSINLCMGEKHNTSFLAAFTYSHLNKKDA